MRFIVFIYGEVIYYIHPEIGYLSRSTFKCIEYFYLFLYFWLFLFVMLDYLLIDSLLFPHPLIPTLIELYRVLRLLIFFVILYWLFIHIKAISLWTSTICILIFLYIIFFISILISLHALS